MRDDGSQLEPKHVTVNKIDKNCRCVWFNTYIGNLLSFDTETLTSSCGGRLPDVLGPYTYFRSFFLPSL